MVLSKFSTAFALATALLVGPLAAQDHKIQLGVYAGGVDPVSPLGQVAYPLGGGAVGYRHFTKGVTFGANGSYWLDNNLGLRVDAGYAGSKAVQPLVGCLPECKTSWTKIFLGGDIMLRAPTASGLTPFGYFGGGVAMMSEKAGRQAKRPTARVGGGLNFTPANSALGFFGELGLVVYDFDQTRFTFYDRVQTDLALKVGVSYGL